MNPSATNLTGNNLTGNNLPSSNIGMTGTDKASSVANRAHEAVDKAADKAAPIVERASAVAHQTIDKVLEYATPAEAWAAESRKQLAAKSTEIAEQCSSFVRARPLATVAGAFVVGYLLAKMRS